MKIAILLLGCSLSTGLLAAIEDREAQQAKLDAACQQAQQQLIGQGKQERVDGCIEEGGKAAKCQQEFASFGQREGNKRPDFSTVPACQQAEAYRKSYRQ
ncbi:hypothetical protein MNZ22_10990 [Aeromonas encheleia]|uniref:hypothetical protein n=1 Tax=Aeromonas TaxID=642 RepID=UPI001C45CF4C|nr:MULTISPECIES: hypothetical protein [Aeromonas]MBV7596747.1 hypothetical protein [Aeromonas sp. sia0103]UNP87387.1 hypothetical protein MNZ22_10990 [Aeromonas encheleia]